MSFNIGSACIIYKISAYQSGFSHINWLIHNNPIKGKLICSQQLILHMAWSTLDVEGECICYQFMFTSPEHSSTKTTSISTKPQRWKRNDTNVVCVTLGWLSPHVGAEERSAETSTPRAPSSSMGGWRKGFHDMQRCHNLQRPVAAGMEQ